MFVYSVKGSTLKILSIISAAIVLMISLLLLIPQNTESVEAATQLGKINYNKIKTNDDRIAFLKQFGWEVEPVAKEEVTVKIPRTFDDLLSSYNKIQLHQGLDLEKYTGKEVNRYSYKVTNYPNYTGEVTANIIVYRNRVIGGDVCSSDVDGFIHDFTFPATGTEEPKPTETTPETAPETSPETTPETTTQTVPETTPAE